MDPRKVADPAWDEKIAPKIQEIAERIREGTHQNHAAAMSGVPKQRYFEYLSRHPEAKELIDAARAIAAEKARQHLLAVASGQIEAGPGVNANVLMHLLARAHPDEYGERATKVELTGEGGGALKHQVTMDLAEAKRIARLKNTP